MSIFLEPAMPDVLKCKVTYSKLDSSDILPELYMFVFLTFLNNKMLSLLVNIGLTRISLNFS